MDLTSKLRAIVRTGGPKPVRELTYEPDDGYRNAAALDPDYVASALGGRRVSTRFGDCMVIDRRYESERWHGGVQIGDCTLDDLASLDPELYQGLIFLKHYQGNPEDLSLNFAVTEEGALASSLRSADIDAALAARVRCRQNHRPVPKRQQHAGHPREQVGVHISHVALSPYGADQAPERGVLRRARRRRAGRLDE